MLGSSSDVARHGIYLHHSNLWPSNNFSMKSIGVEADGESPVLTMLIIDYHVRSSSQSLVIRVQQPRVLVVLDFILPVVEFFVPSLGMVTGRDEMMHPENDPFTKSEDIVLSQSIFFQQSDDMYLSPQRRLIADGCDIDEFIYDGCNGTLHLITDSELKNGTLGTHPPIILIGRGKKLRFRNVKIEVCNVMYASVNLFAFYFNVEFSVRPVIKHFRKGLNYFRKIVMFILQFISEPF